MATGLNITAAQPTEQESPIARVHRLARELADALNWYNDGAWSAHVYPSETKGFSLTQDVAPRSRSMH